jgi:hypothetical protein
MGRHFFARLGFAQSSVWVGNSAGAVISTSSRVLGMGDLAMLHARRL